MHWLYRLQHRIAITTGEARALLGLLALFIGGLTVRYVQGRLQPVPESAHAGFYAEADSVFARHSAGSPAPEAVSRPDPLPAPVQAGPPRTTGGAPAPFDLNTATAAQLERLPGIGPRLAERIILDRQDRGEFQRVEDLVRVRGIGPKMLAKVAPLLYVRAADGPLRPAPGSAGLQDPPPG